MVLSVTNYWELWITNVNSYQVKMLLLYSVRTTILTFYLLKNEIHSEKLEHNITSSNK